MESRLAPINALLSLVIPTDAVEPVLHNNDYTLGGLEVRTFSRGHKGVTIDVLLWHRKTNHMIYCEAKSGANVEPEQALKYVAVPPTSVVQNSHIVVGDGELTAETIYVCLGKHLPRIRYGLNELDLSLSIVAVYPDRIALDGAEHASPELREAFQAPLQLHRAIPRLIPFDEKSDVDTVRRFVHTALVKAMSRKAGSVTIRRLAEDATPQYAMYTRHAQEALRKKVASAARKIAEEDPERLMFLPLTGEREATVRILRSPEDNEPPQRTLAYQALARQGKIRKGRRRIPENVDQLDLFAELGPTDDADTGVLSEEVRP